MEDHIIINIGRQLGSGGHVIGRMLALDFNANYYDRELLNLAAKESGFSEKVFEQNDERKGFFRGLLSMGTPHFNSGSVYKSSFSQESLFQFQSDAIKKAAEKGSCVFVGRCADYILRENRNVVNIFISAPMKFRIEQMMSRQNIGSEEARHLIEQEEGHRAQYYNYYTGKKWGMAESYDFCIDSSVLGLAETEKMIAAFVRKRFEI